MTLLGRVGAFRSFHQLPLVSWVWILLPSWLLPHRSGEPCEGSAAAEGTQPKREQARGTGSKPGLRITGPTVRWARAGPFVSWPP